MAYTGFAGQHLRVVFIKLKRVLGVLDGLLSLQVKASSGQRRAAADLAYFVNGFPALCAALEGLLLSPFRHQEDNLACPFPACSARALNKACLGPLLVKAHDEVDVTNVQALQASISQVQARASTTSCPNLFSHASCYKDVVRAGSKLSKNCSLL